MCYRLRVPQTKRQEVGMFLAVGLTFLAGVSLRAVVALAAYLRAYASGADFAHELSVVAADPVNLALAQAVGFGATLGLGLALARGGGRARDDLAVPLPAAALLVVAGAALQFPLSELGNLLAEIWPTPMVEQLARRDLLAPNGLFGGFALVLALVLVAPVTEELLFRGLILRGVAARHGELAGLALSSLLFAALHSGAAVVPALFAGLVLGIVALRTGSTLASMLLHAAVNAVPVLLPERVYLLRGFNVASEHVYHLPLALIVGTSVLAFAALLFLFRMSDSESE